MRLHFIPALLISLLLACTFAPLAPAQSCGAHGVAVQVLGSGGPELQDKRASSSYLVWQNGRARVLVDAGGGSALRFGESGAQMSSSTSSSSRTSTSTTAPTSPRSSSPHGLKTATARSPSTGRPEMTSCPRPPRSYPTSSPTTESTATSARS